MPGILVVEDDENLNRGITFSLKKCFNVSTIALSLSHHMLP